MAFESDLAMIDKLERKSFSEPNPFRPAAPSNVAGLSPVLEGYLQEQATNIRAQHNVAQAGDSTFSWELLTSPDMEPRYTLGSLGRFYHPYYGLIQARYCMFESMDVNLDFGGPVGIASSGIPWHVTNIHSLTSEAGLVGLDACYSRSTGGRYGWVIVSGINIHKLRYKALSAPKILDEFVWGDDSLKSGEYHSGTVLGYLRVAAIEATEIDGEYWLAPGAVTVTIQPLSKQSIRAATENELTSLQLSVEELNQQLEVFAGSGGVAGLQTDVAALRASVELASSRITQASTVQTSVANGLAARIAVLEAVETSVDDSEAVKLSTLRLDFDAFKATASANLNQLFAADTEIKSRLQNCETAVGSLTSQIASLTQNVQNMSAGVVSAGTVTVTPAGGISAVNTQAALEELDAEKLTGAVSTPAGYTAVILNSPWTNVGGIHGTAKYGKAATGMVTLSGAITATSGSPTSGVTLFNLPAGYRPSDSFTYAVATTSGVGRIEVTTAGDVIMQAGDIAFTSLSGISFVAG